MGHNRQVAHQDAASRLWSQGQAVTQGQSVCYVWADTMQLRRRRTEGDGSRLDCFTVLKLMECVPRSWRALNGSTRFADFTGGIEFIDAIKTVAA